MSLSQVFRDEFNRLRSLDQRPDYHPEGDVFSHEAYVWFTLRNNLKSGSREQKEMLLVAAFHDIGKIPTTKRKNGDGYIVSYGHAKKSLYYWDAVADILCDGTELRSDVIRWLIKEHMNIKFLDRMNESTVEQKKKEAKELGNLVWKMGIAFAEADNMLSFFDRHNLDYIEPIEPSEEVPVIDRHEEAIGRFENYLEGLFEQIEKFEGESEDKNLFLLRGASGSGKSSIASILESHGAFEISADKYFVDDDGNYNFDASELDQAHDYCQRNAKYAMQAEQELIAVHNTFVSVWEMLQYFYLAAKYNYRVHSIVVENRHGNDTIHNVPERKVDEQKNKMELNL